MLLQPLPAFPCVIFHHSLSLQEELGRVPGLPCVKDGGRGRLPWVFAITAQDPCHSYEVRKCPWGPALAGEIRELISPSFGAGEGAQLLF